jgi:hypothetical protein
MSYNHVTTSGFVYVFFPEKGSVGAAMAVPGRRKNYRPIGQTSTTCNSVDPMSIEQAPKFDIFLPLGASILCRDGKDVWSVERELWWEGQISMQDKPIVFSRRTHDHRGGIMILFRASSRAWQRWQIGTGNVHCSQ